MPALGGGLHSRRRVMVSLARTGLLAAYAAAVYISLTEGLGRALGAGGPGQAGLSLAAAALIAIGFAPARRLAGRVVARTPLGRAGEPYEALTALASTTASAGTTDEAIGELATLLGRGTGAATASVWLWVRGSFVRAAVWPAAGESQGPPPREHSIGAIAAREDVHHVAQVRDAGGTLGALAIARKPGDPITPPEEKLAADLASGAAPLLRTVALTAELAERVREAAQQEAELQASRRRLADAGAAERRRLAEEIRVSFSRRLDGISEEAARLRDVIPGDRQAAARLMPALDAKLTAIIDELRAFARGILPPVLRDHGLAAGIEGLQDAAAAIPVPVRAEVHGVGRYRRGIETAVYFCTLRMIRICSADDSPGLLTVRLTDDGHELAVTVTGGAGAAVPVKEDIDAVTDRLAVLGGSAAFVLGEDGLLNLRATVPVGEADRREMARSGEDGRTG